jgi:hypothetical protein
MLYIVTSLLWRISSDGFVHIVDSDFALGGFDIHNA